MSTPLIPVIVTVSVSAQPLPAANAAQASIAVVITDSSGIAQNPVLLNGSETPTPWSFATSINPGSGSATATALDANGTPIGSPDVQSFSVTAQATFNAPGAISVTPVTSTTAALAAHTAAARASERKAEPKQS
jgi:hypothetical protein